MPPGDTLLLQGDTGHLPPEVQAILDSIRQSQEVVAGGFDDRPQYLFTEWQMLLIVLGVLFFFFLWYVKLPTWLAKRWRARQLSRLEGEKGVLYANWLHRYNPYFKGLTPELRQRFLRRTIDFMLYKRFRFHHMKASEQASVLISGAAVQLTFGLRNYLLDVYPDIHVISKEYFLPNDNEIYQGHVNNRGIHIAWTSFESGYEDYADGENVGLHEMAHAVSFDIFLGYPDRQDIKLRDRLKDFMHTGRPYLRALRKGASHLLDEYATTNFEEFWAVCVETFFEKPEKFREGLPELYVAVCEVLNQDPLRKDIFLDKGLAGLQDA